jgi:hypothetical protein
VTGPEHYREAERLLAGRPKSAEDRAAGIDGDDPWPPNHMDLKAAHVHATLALAAATALGSFDRALSGKQRAAWHEAGAM